MNLKILIGIIISAGLMLPACKFDSAENGFNLHVRIQEEPDCLQPIVSQSAQSTPVECQIMAQMFEYNAGEMVLTPILLDSLTTAQLVDDSTLMYKYSFKKNAKWDDGSPLTAADLEFTVKAALNPFSKNKSWRNPLSNIMNVEASSPDASEFKIFVKRNYLLHQEISGNFNLYPEHIYDNEKSLRNFTIAKLKTNDTTAFTEVEKSQLKSFLASLESAAFCKNQISGAGPYVLDKWLPQSQIVLRKKSSWWGDAYPNDEMLHAFPDKIIYHVIPDEVAAMNALEEGSVDLVTGVNPQLFIKWKNDPSKQSKFEFNTPMLQQYSYIEVNTKNPILEDTLVRQALAHLIPVDQFIRDQMQGLAQRVIGPVHPSRSYYNKNLEPFTFDPKLASELLAKAGWKDNDQDGVLDKKIGSQNYSLNLQLAINPKDVSKNIALIFQDEAKKVGVRIDVQMKEWNIVLKEINESNFELVLLNIRQNPGWWDPYPSWHSSNAKPGGTNRSRFANPQLDTLITQIQMAPTDVARMEAYRGLQELLYRYQPQIFLFSPLERIISSKRIEMVTTDRKPGFVENQIRLRK